MAIGREERRVEREPRFVEVFGQKLAPTALDLIELVELAWHDTYGEISPSEEVIEDMLAVSRGNLAGLVRAARLAVMDRRDLKLAADDARAG